MKNEGIDLSYIGKDTFTINISQLKNDKKLLKLYSQDIQLFINSIDDHNKLLKKIIVEIDKYSPMDHTFNFMKKFQIIIKFQYSYFNNFLEKSRNLFEHLKESIDSNISTISQFLSDIQERADNIKLKTNFFYKQNQFILESLNQTENAIIEDYFKLNKKSEFTTDQLIFECHKNENDFLLLYDNINGMLNEYKNKYNGKIENIKMSMIELSEKAKVDIIDIIKNIKNESDNIIISASNEIQNLQNFNINNKEFEPKLSKYLKFRVEDEDLKNLLHPIRYKINIIDKCNSKLEGTNIQITKKDVYNIVELFYYNNFKMIDNSYYDLNIEKNKIDIIEKTGKLLGTNLINKNKIKNKINIEIIPEEEINNFINLLLSREEYLIEFLSCLNNFRTCGNLEFSEEQFNIIKIVFCKGCDYLLNYPNKNISYYLIILSQTFYKMNNDEKYYIQDEMKDKEFFLNIQFWVEFVEMMINEELIKFEKQIANSTMREEERINKKEDIICVHIISLIPSFKNFNITKESVDSFLSTIIEKYNLSEDKKNYIFSMLTKIK